MIYERLRGVAVQPDTIGAEHSGDRCSEYGLVADSTGRQDLWLRNVSRSEEHLATDAEDARSRYCAQQLTADDCVATFISASGELPGILFMVFIIDRIGRRVTMGVGAGSPAPAACCSAPARLTSSRQASSGSGVRFNA